MSYDNAIKALSIDALKLIRNDFVVGLGSGRAATALVKSLSNYVKSKNFDIKCVPTSMQIKLIAEKGGLSLIDIDQIDKNKFLIKGGGGALLKENILISAAKRVVIMADKSKFVKDFNKTIPVEIHPSSRKIITTKIIKISGKSTLRTLKRGYPFVTENGNLILDCDFGTIKNPKSLQEKISNMPGVLEVGIFTRKPDIIYKAKTNGKFEILT